MAKVTLKDPASKPKKFNKTVVLELTPVEAVVLTSVLCSVPTEHYKSGIYRSLRRAGVPETEQSVFEGPIYPFKERFLDQVEKIAEGTN